MLSLGSDCDVVEWRSSSNTVKKEKVKVGVRSSLQRTTKLLFPNPIAQSSLPTVL
ncbi:hypothetical protein GCK32_010832 [Trichostrongylus colubriformis]|uniref:Uncharacterized protein n=1 Tax=Trichostrongylus colubriformis TaxID=6319 RepID=A0AAN8F9G9_TRICO